MSNILEQLQLDAKYATDINKFINKIIHYLILKKQSDIVGNKALLVLDSETA